MTHRLMVYGSLMRDLYNQRLLADATFIGASACRADAGAVRHAAATSSSS